MLSDGACEALQRSRLRAEGVKSRLAPARQTRLGLFFLSSAWKSRFQHCHLHGRRQRWSNIVGDVVATVDSEPRRLKTRERICLRGSRCLRRRLHDGGRHSSQLKLERKSSDEILCRVLGRDSRTTLLEDNRRK